MKKFIFIGFLALSILACSSPQVLVTPTYDGVLTETPTVEVTVTVTNTPDPTVTPFTTFVPVPTETLSPTPTQLIPLATSTNVPCQIPCGPNHFFNEGLEGRYEARNTDRFNQLTPEFWSFEYRTGQHPRRQDETLDIPEAGDINCITTPWDYRVDGCQQGVNEQSARWFKAWGLSDSGISQRLAVTNGNTYVIGARVQTWAADNPNETGRYSKLASEDDRRNVEWQIRVNLANGGVFDANSVVCGTFDYDDGIYDNYATIQCRITIPAGNTLTRNINVGFTASNLWRWGNTDFHIDNTFMYCVDCGFGQPQPTYESLTPTPIVRHENPLPNSYAYILVDGLTVRVGASRQTDCVPLVNGCKTLATTTLHKIYLIFINESTGEEWVLISDPNLCTAEQPCEYMEWIAIKHPICPNSICAEIQVH